MRAMSHALSTMLLALGGTFCVAAHAAAEENWPHRPVHVIVQVGPGTGVDIPARLYAARLAERWKQPVIVENRPGADGLIGTVDFARAHDDHTLLFGPAAPISVFPYIRDNLGYDPARDVVPISRGAETFVVMTASVASKINSLGELVARVRAQPGKLNYHAGPGAFPTLIGGFLKSYGLNMVQIAYRQDNLAMEDLATGRLDVMLSTMAAVLPAVQSGKAHFLAVTNRERAPLAPDVPTVTEAGYPELAFQGLLGFFGPPEMSAALRSRIATDIRTVAADPAFSEKLLAIAQVAHGSTPEEFAAAIEEQRAKIAGIVAEIGRPGQ
jgi:tripartite-type tricarboxylate transporter receptor subunit TctC